MGMSKIPVNFPNQCIYVYIYIYYIIVMWFSMFVCSHPGPGKVEDVIDWCGRCWIAAVLEEEIGMVENIIATTFDVSNDSQYST